MSEVASVFIVMGIVFCIVVNQTIKWRKAYDLMERKYKNQILSTRVAELRGTGYKIENSMLRQKLARQQNSKEATAQQRTGLTESEVRKLRILCHPDKHGNSQLATKVTTWLNSMTNRSERCNHEM